MQKYFADAVFCVGRLAGALAGTGAGGLVFIHWMLTLTRILNILTWTSRAISHNMLPAEEKLENYHHKDTGWLCRRHLMINLYTFQLGRVELVELEELEELEEYAGAGRNDSTILL